jgi:hypothetical protein
MENVYYVYLHRRASDNNVFYVGKGKGKRAYSTEGRNERWNRTFKKHGLVVEIAFDNLSEDDAFNIEIDTITEMRYFYPDFIVNMTAGGRGLFGYKASKSTRALIRKNSTLRAKELIERSSDKNIYSFLQISTKQVVKCTRLELCSRFNLNHYRLRALFKTNPCKHSQDFTILRDGESVDDCLVRASTSKVRKVAKPRPCRATTVKHCFVSADGTAIWATQREFENAINKKLAQLIGNTNRVVHKLHGWVLLGDREFIESLGYAQNKHKQFHLSDQNVYSFYNKTLNISFVGTRAELSSEFNIKNPIRLTELFCTRRRQSVYGWSLLKEPNE